LTLAPKLILRYTESSGCNPPNTHLPHLSMTRNKAVILILSLFLLGWFTSGFAPIVELATEPFPWNI